MISSCPRYYTVLSLPNFVTGADRTCTMFCCKSWFDIVDFIWFQKEQTTSASLATLPASFQTLAPQATEYCLACVSLPPDVSIPVQRRWVVGFSHIFILCSINTITWNLEFKKKHCKISWYMVHALTRNSKNTPKKQRKLFFLTYAKKNLLQ